MWAGDSAPVVQPSTVKLQTYTGEEIGVVGSITVTAQGNGLETRLPLLVVEGNGPSLLPHDWLPRLHLDWKKILALHTPVTGKHTGVTQSSIKPELGTLRGMEVKLHVEEQAQTLFFKARTVPFTLRQKVEQEQERCSRKAW